MSYKFNNKHLTRGIKASIPIEIQIFLWKAIDELVRAGVELDYLQIFRISKSKNMITIIHEQEEPIAFRKDYKLLNEDLVKLDIKESKIYVIDDGKHATMLLAEEY